MKLGIYWLHEAVLLDAREVGGKAVGLVRLYSLGANVPEGVVVAANTQLTPAVLQSVDAAVATIAIAHPGAMFAVRSSATDEDGQNTSYAGMYKTLLNVPPDRIREAVDECRRSAASRRLAAYRTSLDTRAGTGDPGIAVVIQRMLLPEFSGVCFTINPVTGNANEVIIEVARGLGERLVSGMVTPDYYCVDRSTGALIEYQAGEDSMDGVPLLTHGMRTQIFEQTRAIAASFGKPVDVEFAFAAGILFLLQARPVTRVSRGAA